MPSQPARCCYPTGAAEADDATTCATGSGRYRHQGRWPSSANGRHDIPESRVEIDGRLILDAAARAIELWTEDSQASD
jgi:hypothetical protein